MTVTASDGSLRASATVTINVTDVNEGAEITSADPSTRTVAEDAAYGSTVGAGPDPEGDSVSWSLDGPNKNDFLIHLTTGALTVASALDFETRPSYALKVRITDRKDRDGNIQPIITHDDEIDLTITVTNADDAGVVTLSTDSPAVGAAVTASLTDQDGGVTVASWQWAKGANRTGTFTEIPGATSSSYTPVEADAGSYLRAWVAYTDAHDSGKSASAVTDAAVPPPGAPDKPAPPTVSGWRPV